MWLKTDVYERNMGNQITLYVIWMLVILHSEEKALVQKIFYKDIFFLIQNKIYYFPTTFSSEYLDNISI